MKTLLSIFCLVSLASTAWAGGRLDRDPVGETAFYRLDTNSSRTSSIFQSGHMDTEVTRFLPDDPDGPAYELKIDYKVSVLFQGTQEGTEITKLPAEYFTDQFLVDLRANGEYISEDFKVRHEGYGDARTLDGAFYPNCDKILIYDIKTTKAFSFLYMPLAAYYGIETDKDQLENLQVRASIYPGVPVLGAVKLDVSGVYSGFSFKGGADFIAP